MSRYSHRVEKLLKESKSPSLDILLEKEGEEAEEATASAEPSSDDAGGDEGIPDDAFDSEDDNEDKSGEDAASDEEPEGADDEAAGEGGDVNNEVDLEGDLAKLERIVQASEEAGKKIKKASDKYSSFQGEFFNALKGATAFESKLYNTKGIKSFIFEAEDDSNEKIADSIESLQSALDSEENQLPDPYELAQIANKYFNRFDEVDRAIYIIKLVAIYFKKIINPDKDKVFDEFIDNFLAILQKDGIDIELDYSKAVKYKTAVGARTAG